MQAISAFSKMFLVIFAYATFLLVEVSSSGSIRESLFRNGPCMRYQYRCLNDKCIARHLLCNNKDDCGDNSDERYCNIYAECPRQLSYFRCSNLYNYNKRCIPMTWKCDGINDCWDKTDENECDINNDKELTGGRLQLASNLSQSWIVRGRNVDLKLQKWGTDLPRKTVALYLSNKTLFESNHKYGDELAYELTNSFFSKLLQKRIEDFSTADIASFINAFLVTCIDPSEIFQLDLKRELRKRVDNMENANPFALLALCNAKEPITHGDVRKLQDAFWVAHEKNRIDTMAMTILALSCALSQDNVIDQEDLSKLAIDLKKLQYRNGSVQNAKTTGLVLQAVFASDREPDEDNFDELKALQQIIRSQKTDGSFGNLASTYFILPVLSGLSLVNISSEHCPVFISDENEGFQRLQEEVGEKMTVLYSIWIGDERFVQRTLTISVPVNISFYGAMEFASGMDMNYRFQYNIRHHKPYLYSLYQLIDDAETEMYWSLHQLINETSGEVKTIHTSPADVYPKNNDHFVYWYKSEE